MKFIDYLMNDRLYQIEMIVKTLTEDELDEFGYYLFTEFFDFDGEIEFFEIDDVMSMIEELGPDFYSEILAMLEEEINEGVSRIMVKGNMNRKKRNFMTKSKGDLRKEKGKRKQSNRANKSKNKRYYRANKKKIASYQKSRSGAIKKGTHSVKLRRSV